MNGSTASTAAAVVRLDDYRPADLVPRIELDRARADLAQLRTAYLALSDAAGVAGQLARRDAVAIGHERYAAGWREGYEAGARRLVDEWPAIVAGVVDGGPTLAELQARRSVPAGRVRDHDRTGAQLVADARASWLAAGLSLTPPGETADLPAGRQLSDGGA